VLIPVAARSKAWICGRSVAGLVGSNSAGGMDDCCEYCVSECDGEDSITRRPWLTMGVAPWKKQIVSGATDRN
jgi:hypothetical protein